jgi:hypothetical protein
MTQATNVNRQLHPTTGEPIGAIEATNLRRHFGNRLVVPPFKYNARKGVIEHAVLDGKGGYFYPSERAAAIRELQGLVAVADAEQVIEEAR